GFSTSASGTALNDFAGGPTGLNDGTWHHGCAVYDGTDKILYLDGSEVARNSSAHGGAALGTSSTRFGFIGDGSEASTYNGSRNNIFYQGELDNVRYYTRTLSPSEIATLAS
ncbi:hypothetical protein IIC68_03785, partial [archaeon]|nr:hypothetical protein [archaeon]